jgi:hypothetical protein
MAAHELKRICSGCPRLLPGIRDGEEAGANVHEAAGSEVGSWHLATPAEDTEYIILNPRFRGYKAFMIMGGVIAAPTCPRKALREIFYEDVQKVAILKRAQESSQPPPSHLIPYRFNSFQSSLSHHPMVACLPIFFFSCLCPQSRQPHENLQ